MTDHLPAVVTPDTVQLGVINASTPSVLVARATEAADALASVISAKKLYSTIQGKQYVRCEGWTTLAAMMGCLPREVSNVEAEGRYTATVELVRMHDGAILTRASAECGPDEPTWKSRSLYARRSMAATRATSKACRLAFSWVMALAGYDVTPAEEIPAEERRPAKPTRPFVNPTAKDLSEKPEALTADEDGVVVGPKVVTWPFAKAVGSLKTGVGIDASIVAEDLRGALQFIDEYTRTPTFERLVARKGVMVSKQIDEIREHIETLLAEKTSPEAV